MIAAPRGVKAHVLVNRTVFVAGRNVTGRVDIHANSDWNIKSFKVTLVGVQRKNTCRERMRERQRAGRQTKACGRVGECWRDGEQGTTSKGWDNEASSVPDSEQSRSQAAQIESEI